MIWTILAIVFIGALAYAMRKASRGTAFERRCPCTPMIEHLRWVEKGEKREEKPRENLW